MTHCGKPASRWVFCFRVVVIQSRKNKENDMFNDAVLQTPDRIADGFRAWELKNWPIVGQNAALIELTGPYPFDTDPDIASWNDTSSMMVCVLRGLVDLRTEVRTYRYRAGESVFVPARLKYRWNLPVDSALLLNMSAPAWTPEQNKRVRF